MLKKQANLVAMDYNTANDQSSTQRNYTASRK